VWRERFLGAELRIVTGSRTLLEALETQGPFLYFNGVTQRGRATRRHRPEKIDALLRVWRRMGVSAALCRDLADFSRAWNVGAIARRALHPSFARRFPRGIPTIGFRWPRRSVGELLDAVAKEHARGAWGSEEIVRRVRDDQVRWSQ
jgi:hypothetical protein